MCWAADEGLRYSAKIFFCAHIPFRIICHGVTHTLPPLRKLAKIPDEGVTAPKNHSGGPRVVMGCRGFRFGACA